MPSLPKPSYDPNRKDIRRRTSPNAHKHAGGAAVHAAPGVAVKMDDTSFAPNRKNIRRRIPPNAEKLNFRIAVHPAPSIAIVVQDHSGAADHENTEEEVPQILETKTDGFPRTFMGMALHVFPS